MKCLFFIGGLLLAWSSAGICGDAPPVRLPVVDGADLQFDHVAFGEEPSHARVGHIAQDDLGFLWFSTTDGLKRYDGYTFRDYRHDPANPNSLSGSWIYSLFKDRSGKLWIGSDQFLDRYDPATDTFTHIGADGTAARQFQGQVVHISQDREGIIWLATAHGLNRWDPATSRIVRYQHTPHDPSTIANDLVKSTFEERDGTFWVATAEGLDIFDRRSGKVTSHFALLAVPELGRMTLLEDHAGVLWAAFSSGNGLATVDRRANKVTQYRFNESGADPTLTTGVRAIYEDREGALWLATANSGILKLGPDRKHFIRYQTKPDDPDSLRTNNTAALFEDSEGSIWVGTYGGGVQRFTRKPLPFRRYRLESRRSRGPDDDVVNTVFEDSHGVLWIGTEGAFGLLNRETGTFAPYRTAGGESLTRASVLAIAEDRSGSLWFGTRGGGLYRFDRRTGQFRVFRHDPGDPYSLSHDVVYSLDLDRGGTLWVGTANALDRFDATTERFQVYGAGQGGTGYTALAEDADGMLWLGTGGEGVHRLDPATGRVTVYRHTEEPGSLSGDYVNTLWVDGAGTVWVATRSGLNRFEAAPRKFTAFFERDGLPNSNVSGITEDADGCLWLTTNNGISRFDPRSRIFSNYHASDGVFGNEFYGLHAAWRSRNGEIILGGAGGLTAFFPGQLVDTPYVPPVVLVDFQLSGKSAGVGDGSPLRQPIAVTRFVTLTHEQHVFSFEFSALSYSDPDGNRYRYRLEGLQPGWTETDSDHRTARYTTLPAGDYVFHVEARTSRGAWNTQGVLLQIRILPPFWATWWFRALCVVLLAVSLWAYYRYRLRQIAHQFGVRLDERVAERTRIARELHDTLLQSFQGLMLRFQTVDDLLPQRPLEAKRALEGALDRADQAIAEGREAVQNLRSSSGVSNDLAGALTALGEELAAPAGNESSPAFRVVVEGAPRDLHPILRDEIYGIAREALRNAFNHARARVIEGEITYSNRLLRLRIRDDGVGMDRSVLATGRDGHWGLPGMRERAEHIGAQLDVWSELGAGTEIELRVPGAIVYGPFPGQTPKPQADGASS